MFYLLLTAIGKKVKNGDLRFAVFGEIHKRTPNHIVTTTRAEYQLTIILLFIKFRQFHWDNPHKHVSSFDSHGDVINSLRASYNKG